MPSILENWKDKCIASALTIRDVAYCSKGAFLNELPPLHVLHTTNGKIRERGKVKLNMYSSLYVMY